MRRKSRRPHRRVRLGHRRRAPRRRRAPVEHPLFAVIVQSTISTRPHPHDRRNRHARGAGRRRGADLSQRAARYPHRVRLDDAVHRTEPEPAANGRRPLLGPARRRGNRNAARSRNRRCGAAPHQLRRGDAVGFDRRPDARAQRARRIVLRIVAQHRTRRRRLRVCSGGGDARRRVHDAGRNAQRDGTGGDRRHLVR